MLHIPLGLVRLFYCHFKHQKVRYNWRAVSICWILHRDLKWAATLEIYFQRLRYCPLPPPLRLRPVPSPRELLLTVIVNWFWAEPFGCDQLTSSKSVHTAQPGQSTNESRRVRFARIATDFGIVIVNSALALASLNGLPRSICQFS